MLGLLGGPLEWLMNHNFNSIAEAIEDIRQGKLIILVDDEDRENEGDLCCAAQFATPEAVNFMATHGRGLICLTLTPQKVEQLALPMMTSNNTSVFGTPAEENYKLRITNDNIRWHIL